MSALLFLAAAAGQASPPPLGALDGADARCIVVAGYAGAHGTPEQAAASKSLIVYFLGRLTGRTPGAPVATIIARAAAEAGANHLNAQAEGARCEAEYRAGTALLLGVRAAAGLPPAGTP